MVATVLLLTGCYQHVSIPDGQGVDLTFPIPAHKKEEGGSKE